MFSSCRLLLMTGLLTACEVTSLEVHSPGTQATPMCSRPISHPG